MRGRRQQPGRGRCAEPVEPKAYLAGRFYGIEELGGDRAGGDRRPARSMSFGHTKGLRDWGLIWTELWGGEMAVRALHKSDHRHRGERILRGEATSRFAGFAALTVALLLLLGVVGLADPSPGLGIRN